MLIDITPVVVYLQILLGGYNWDANLNIAKSLINMRGGPAVLLARSLEPKLGAISGVSRARLFVEIVSIYDIFGKAFAGGTADWTLTKSNPRLSGHWSGAHASVSADTFLVVRLILNKFILF